MRAGAKNIQDVLNMAEVSLIKTLNIFICILHDYTSVYSLVEWGTITIGFKYIHAMKG